MDFGEKLEKMLSRAVGEIGQELQRAGVHGAAEIGSGLFTGQSYVPYGQGQNRPGAVHGMEGLHNEGKEEIQHENEGRSM
jgi:hypothetical protein